MKMLNIYCINSEIFTTPKRGDAKASKKLKLRNKTSNRQNNIRPAPQEISYKIKQLRLNIININIILINTI